MATDEAEDGLRIVLTLYPGRDDLAIAELGGVKSRFRAERVRVLLQMLLSGKSVEQVRELRPAQEEVTRAAGDKQANSEANSAAPKAEASPASAGVGAADDEYDISQLDGVSIQTDFTSF